MNCPDCHVRMDRQEDYDVRPPRRLRLVDVAYQCPECDEIFHLAGGVLQREEIPVDVVMARR